MVVLGVIECVGLGVDRCRLPLDSRLPPPCPHLPSRLSPVIGPGLGPEPFCPKAILPKNCSCSWMIMKFERGKRLALWFPLTITVYSWGISLRTEIMMICMRSLLSTHVSPYRIHNKCYFKLLSALGQANVTSWPLVLVIVWLTQGMRVIRSR